MHYNSDYYHVIKNYTYRHRWNTVQAWMYKPSFHCASICFSLVDVCENSHAVMCLVEADIHVEQGEDFPYQAGNSELIAMCL